MSGSAVVGVQAGVMIHPRFRTINQRVAVASHGLQGVRFGSLFYNGGKSITGNVYLGAVDTPVARRVVLFHRDSHTRVSETTSSAVDGYFEFTNLPTNMGEFYVVAFDENPPTKRAEAFDSLTPA